MGLISLGLNVYQFIRGRQKDKLLIHYARALVTNAANLARDCEEGKVYTIGEAGRRAGQLGNFANALLAAIAGEK